MRRVVITGIGIVSSIGSNAEEVKKSLFDCTPGISKAIGYDNLGFKSQVYGSPNIDLEENIDIHFPDEREYDTLAGFILDSLKSIPKKGEFVEYENYTFKVIQIEQNRIDKVEITRKHRFNK